MDSSTLTAAQPQVSPQGVRPGEVANHATYISFGLAYLVGHGAAAVSRGTDPLIVLPPWLPMVLLGVGLAAGTVFATLAAVKAQRAASKTDVLSGRLLGMSWIVGFAALFLAITGLTSTSGNADLSSVLWPAGSGLIVGLIYLGEGASRRNVLHYSLGTWLALMSAAALSFGTPGTFWILAIGGGAGFAVAAILESRRLRAHHLTAL